MRIYLTKRSNFKRRRTDQVPTDYYHVSPTFQSQPGYRDLNLPLRKRFSAQESESPSYPQRYGGYGEDNISYQDQLNSQSYSSIDAYDPSNPLVVELQKVKNSTVNSEQPSDQGSIPSSDQVVNLETDRNSTLSPPQAMSNDFTSIDYEELIQLQVQKKL